MFILLLGIFASILVALLFLKQYKARKLPPGPIGLPVFGYYFFLGKNPILKLHELSKIYGKVFSLRIGPKNIVMLDDWTTAKEILRKTTILERPDSTFARVPYGFGVSGANGHKWLQYRRVTTKAVKEVVFDKVCWDDLLQEKTSDWVRHIMQENGKPIEVNDFFADRFLSYMAVLFLDERLSSEHPLMKDFTKAVNTVMERTSIFGLANISPTMSKLLRLLNVKDKSVMTKPVMEFANYVANTIDAKIQDPDEAVKENSFIRRFQEEIEIHKKDVTSFITDDCLKGNAFALLTAAAETTRTAFIWMLIAMAEHPEKQEKVHKELDSIIGESGVVKWGEQAKVPYTYASQLESMRWKTAIPFIVRRNTEDLEINGYHIPKGSSLTFNTWAMHNDVKFWSNPEQFIPERFLLENGRKVNSAPESFNPFSFGKRSCIGKELALKASFLIFTTLMQKFEVMPKSGEKVRYDANLGLTYQARNVELRFIQR